MIWTPIINFGLKLLGGKPIKLSKGKQLILGILSCSGVFIWVFWIFVAITLLTYIALPSNFLNSIPVVGKLIN